MDSSTSEAAPAKINLALHVVGQRADGYHDLQSLVVFADVCDELTLSAAETDSLRVSGPFARALQPGENNLVERAVAAFRQHWPDAVPDGLAMHLNKSLPVAAGLGGGSADAAAALRALKRLSRRPIPEPALYALAATLGADVPMCLYSRPCTVRGIGDIITPIPAFPPLHVVLINPLLPVATPDVFRRLRQRANLPLAPLPELGRHGTLLALWLQESRNDLEAPAIEALPVIGTLIEGMARLQGCTLARMSGSGATVFGLFGSGGQAHQAAHDLRAQFPECWVAAAPLLQ